MWHVVHRRFNSVHLGYELWFDNKPALVLSDGLWLKRLEAYQLAKAYNN